MPKYLWKFKGVACLVGALFMEGCGEVVRQTQILPSITTGVPGTMVVVASDFVTGALTIVDNEGVHPNVETTHPDAVVRSFGGLVFVVNRLGQDNLQVIDPGKGFKTIAQWSLGRRSNPQDVYVTEGGIAYTTLYEPERNTDPTLQAFDVVVLNPLTGERLGGIDLTAYTADDGDRRARAAVIEDVSTPKGEQWLCIAIQDLPSNLALPPDREGKIVLLEIAPQLDTPLGRVAGSIPLQCRNPVALAGSASGEWLFVSCADYFDLSTQGGGIEVIDLAGRASRGLWIHDELLGGAPGDLEVVGGFGFVTVGYQEAGTGLYRTKVVRFIADPEQSLELEEAYASEGYIQDLVVSADGTLVIGDRWPHTSGLVFIDPSSLREVRNRLTTGLPPSSMTLVRE